MPDPIEREANPVTWMCSYGLVSSRSGIGKLPSLALDTGIHAGMTVLAEAAC
jgi:hypothetical protein